MNIEFTKMHGLGNDFIVIDNMNGQVNLTKEQISFLCDRHMGVGADGVILVEAKEGVDSTGSPRADCFMNYINADGSKAQMCGNGVRCVAKFLQQTLPQEKQKDIFRVATRSGVKEIQCHEDETYSVNMGKVTFEGADYVGGNTELEGLTLHFVSMGNPFAVSFVDKISDYDFKILGPKIENNKIFPNKMNFELVEEKNKNEFNVRVWERGCGETMACGTGACAIYALSKKLNKIGDELIINFPGGKLFLSSNKDETIMMRGPAQGVYSGFVEVL